MTDLEKFINNVTKNGVENSVYSTDDEIDTYTILGKLNEILKFMQDHPDMKGTIVKILGEAQDIINFNDDPQKQLNILVEKYLALDEHVAQLVESVTRLDLNKADALTVKLDSVSEITSLETFRSALYNLRKSPQRSYQLQEAEAKRVLNIIGYPSELSQDTNILLYVDLPYSEAGGFEIDITAMGRNGKHLYKRTMYSTLNANWQDTGWSNQSLPLVNKGEATKISMAPSNNFIDNIFSSGVAGQQSFNLPANGYITIVSNTEFNLFNQANALNIGIGYPALSSFRGYLVGKKGDIIVFDTLGTPSSIARARFIYAEEV